MHGWISQLDVVWSLFPGKQSKLQDLYENEITVNQLKNDYYLSFIIWSYPFDHSLKELGAFAPIF